MTPPLPLASQRSIKKSVIRRGPDRKLMHGISYLAPADISWQAMLARWVNCTGWAAWSVIRPIWQFNSVLGPLAILVWIAGAFLVGFLTSNVAWGLVMLVGVFGLLAFAEVVRRVVADDAEAPGIQVSDRHRDGIQGIARNFRLLVINQNEIREDTDDFRCLRGHFASVAMVLTTYNRDLWSEDFRRKQFSKYVEALVETGPVKEDRRSSVHDLIVTTMTRLMTIPEGLLLPLHFERQDLDGLALETTSIYPNELWPIAQLDDPDLHAIRVAVEQMMNDVKSSTEARALVNAVDTVHRIQNDVARLLDQVIRRDSITGTCADCVL